jgi:hypothetical protein
MVIDLEYNSDVYLFKFHHIFSYSVKLFEFVPILTNKCGQMHHKAPALYQIHP